MKAIAADKIKICPCCRGEPYSRGCCKARYEMVRRWIRAGKNGIKVKVPESPRPVIMTDRLATKLGYLAPHQAKNEFLVKPLYQTVPMP